MGRSPVVPVLLIAMVLALSASAQVRYQIGDDVRWAEPGFDDSGWPVAADGRAPLPTGTERFFWVRARVAVPEGVAGPLAVMDPDCVTLAGLPIQVFVNGALVGTSGTLPPNAVIPLIPHTCVFEIAGIPRGGVALVAIRRWAEPRRIPAQNSGAKLLNATGPEIDTAAHLREREAGIIGRIRLALVPQLAVSTAVMALGLALILLWWRTRATPVLGWLGLSMVFSHLAYVAIWNWPLAVRPHVMLHSWTVTAIVLTALARLVSLQFFWAVFDLGRKTLLWALQVLVIFIGALALAAGFAESATGYFVFAFGTLQVCFYLLYGTQFSLSMWQIFTQRDRRWIAVAETLNALFGLSATGGVLPLALTLPSVVKAGTLLLVPTVLSGTAYQISVVALLLRRFWRAWRQSEELDAEFQAAREMQAELVPLHVAVPGFRIEVAYHPARQVGGDFFRVLQGENGAALVVVGDVSGKGLKAAMTVAAIAGALDNEFSRRPCEVLEHLNRALRSRKGEGFVTCCAALVARSGEVVIANAGHLPPYAGGVEQPVEAELPLGIVDGVSYAETRLWLKAGETLTFVSDGVVEAANAAGELFGFERTRAISGDGPEAIARAAREFGQDDDITVVSVGLAEAA